MISVNLVCKVYITLITGVTVLMRPDNNVLVSAWARKVEVNRKKGIVFVSLTLNTDGENIFEISINQFRSSLALFYQNVNCSVYSE